MGNPILVLCPMECEYRVLKKKAEIQKVDFFGDFEYAVGSIDSYPVVMVKCLAGFINSAAASMHFIDKFEPCCVIIQGTAGAHNRNLKVNDIILGEKIVENQTYFSKPRSEGDGSRFEDWSFIGVERLDGNGNVQRIREYTSNERLMKIAEKVPYEYGNVRRGTICSGDAWNREIDRIKYFVSGFNSDCEEMEAFSVAQVCEMLHIPHLSIRIISNSEFIEDGEFSERPAEICQLYCYDVIKAIIDDKR